MSLCGFMVNTHSKLSKQERCYSTPVFSNFMQGSAISKSGLVAHLDQMMERTTTKPQHNALFHDFQSQCPLKKFDLTKAKLTWVPKNRKEAELHL